MNSVSSSSCWLLPLPGAHVPLRAGRSQGEVGKVSVFMLGHGIRAHGRGVGGRQCIPDPSRTMALQCFLAGMSWASCPLPAGGCGRAGIAFLCRRKQLPGVSQAAWGLEPGAG